MFYNKAEDSFLPSGKRFAAGEEGRINEEEVSILMRKSRYGFNLWFYPAIVLLLAIFGQTLLCGLITIFAIAAEKDEWTSRQTMEAFLLSLVNALVSVIIDLFGIITWIPLLGDLLSRILAFCAGVIGLVVLVVAVIGILRASKNEEIRIPIVHGFVNKIFA